MKDAIGEAARMPYRCGWREVLPDFVCRTACERSTCLSVFEGLLDSLRRNSGERSVCLVWLSAVPSEPCIGTGDWSSCLGLVSVFEGLLDLLRRNFGERSACLVRLSAVPSETFIGTGDWSSCLFVVPVEISSGMSKVALRVRLDRSSGQISFISQVGATVLN